MRADAAALRHSEPGKSIVTTAETKRLDDQIAADGGLPRELSRTRSFHYATFDLIDFGC